MINNPTYIVNYSWTAVFINYKMKYIYHVYTQLQMEMNLAYLFTYTIIKRKEGKRKEGKNTLSPNTFPKIL